MKRAHAVTGGLFVAGLAVLAGGEVPEARSAPPGDAARARLVDRLGRLPLRFEQSGDRAEGARYVSRGPGYTMFVMPTEMVLSLWKGDGQRREPRPALRGEGTRPSIRTAVLRVKLVQARPDAEMQGLEELPGKANYLIGRDTMKWRTSVPGYARVLCRGVYPGIDLVYYGSQREMEYDFVVAPGADPTRIRLGFEGARELRVDGAGNLVIGLEGGEVVKRAPRLYQEEGTKRRTLGGRWILRGVREAGFEVGAYDPKRALVIDPVLSYSTYLGGSNEEFGFGIVVDSSGSAYITGRTTSIDFPTRNPYQTDQPNLDVFVTKLSPSGDTLVYSTYFGGSGLEEGYGIAIDGSGSAYVTGVTSSLDFPTQNPYQTLQFAPDVFVTKLSPSGTSLVYSTYLGGDSNEIAYGIAVDGSGSAYVTGPTDSTNFPTLDPYQTNQPGRDAFVTKLSPAGNTLAYSTYLGGTGSNELARGIVVDGSGSAYVTGITDSTDFPTLGPYQTDQTGYDAFVTKLSPSGTSLEYSTYLGGTGDEEGDGIAVDSSGSAYINGWTSSTDFPTQNPYQTDRPGFDAFVTKLSPSGSSLAYSTYLGGGGDEWGGGIAVDASSSAYVTGLTDSTDFPTQDPYQTDQTGYDAFVTKLSADGMSLVYSTYLGGGGFDAGNGIAVDALGSAYVVGDTESMDFPTLNPYQTDQPATDVFVTKLGLPPMDFFTVAPCRVVDTRNASGPYGGPALGAGTNRSFALAGQCGISSTARAISANVTVAAPSASGNLRLYAAGVGLPMVSSINYSAGQTRANNAIVSLDTAGAVTVYSAQPSGAVHIVIDVSGYFE